MSDYLDFLASKRVGIQPTGFEVAADTLNPLLFLYQRDCTRWALRLGKAALFQECGLGKTLQEFEWAQQVARHTGGKVLILTVLAVAYQMLDEAAKFGYDVRYCKEQADIGDAQIVITNYSRLHKFDAASFAGVVLDESSILKNYTGKTKRALLEAFKDTPYKLAATATPAPNDYLELGNHAEFLDIMPSNEMISRWFANDTMKAGKYDLKKHARADFFRWLTEWGVCLSTPSDLGEQYAMPSFVLPPLHIHEHVLNAAPATIERAWADGLLFPDTNPSATSLHKVKRESLDSRVQAAAELAGTDESPLIIWCDTDYEADALKAAFPNALEVRGSHKDDVKETRLKAFTHNEVQQIISKPEIAGFGLNWQHCARQIFVGVSYSFERTYQALRRSYRFGQANPVHAHMIYAETEGSIMTTIRHKQGLFQDMQGEMNRAMHAHGLFRDDKRRSLTSALGTTPMVLPDWLYSKGA